MNYFAALPPATALPSKLHTAYQKVIPLAANGFPFSKLLCELHCSNAFNEPCYFHFACTNASTKLYCHSVPNVTATSDRQIVKHHHCRCHHSYNYVRHGHHVGRNSSVGIATHYGLHGPGIESRCGEIFRTRPYRPCGPPSRLYNGYWVFLGGKAAGAWC
jgi:hypothetical protein